MKPNSNATTLLDRIQWALTIVMVVTTLHRRDQAIDAEHAHNAAAYRIAVLIICMIGTIVVQSIKYVIKRNAPPITAVDPMQKQYQPQPGQREINITYHSNTRAAHWRCNLYVLFHQPQTVGVFSIVGLSVGYYLARWVYSLNPSLALITVPLAFIAGLSAPALLVCALIWLELLKRFATMDVTRICTSILTAEGFYDITPDKSKFVPWIGLKSLREHNGDIYLFASGVSGNFIPRKAFRDLGIAKQFYQDAVGLWKSNGAIWPDGPPDQP